MNELRQIGYALYLAWGVLVEGVADWIRYGDFWKFARRERAHGNAVWVAGVWTDDAEGLRAYVSSEISKRGMFAIKMPCGAEYTYTSASDFPTATTLCKCGDPRHVVVGYGGARGRYA